jgi:hypothetical protein
METLGEFSATHKANIGLLKNIARSLIFFLQGAIRANLTPLFVRDDLMNLGLSEDHASIFIIAIKV